MIPPFVDGLLPPGIHAAVWSEVRDRFGITRHRRQLLMGAYRALVDLRAAGCGRAWLDGSFVTAKEHPGDFDLAWDPVGVDGSLLHPVLLDIASPRVAQHVRYGGDIVPNVREANTGTPFLDFFQQDSITGEARGIVLIELAGGL